jgi:phosphatidylglycerophosphate synthase
VSRSLQQSPHALPRPYLVWIEASDPCCKLRVFGMTLLERLLRSLLAAGLEGAEVYVEGSAGAEVAPRLPADLGRRLQLRFRSAAGSPRAGLERVVRAGAGRPVLALEADALVDARLLAHIGAYAGALAACGGAGVERAAVVRLDGEVPGSASDAGRLSQLADAWIAAGAVKELSLAEVPDYLTKLRRSVAAYCFRIRDDSGRDRAERFLFESNYKGSTDVLTKYVYPPLVWRALHPLARWRVHPNWISLFNVVITLGAVPLFAAAHWVPGLLLAYAMSVLDSVDGKLARLTFRASKLGDVLDHGLDIVHPPIWYVAWAWPLGGGDPGSAVFQASLWMAGFYVLDRLVILAFKRTTGISIHGYTEFDARMRTWISRRNINLPIFTVGLVVGAPVEAFALIVAWQLATLAFHAVRLGQVRRQGRHGADHRSRPAATGAPR